jgi:nucleoside-diphosphate-sugar epimerase
MISGISETIHIVGCGDIGQRVAVKWQQQGGEAEGLVASAASAARLEQAGTRARMVDLDRPDTLYQTTGLSPEQRPVYYFAPPPPQGREDSRLRGWLAALGETRPRKIVLISTTGVYGDAAGGWLTEQSPVSPRADRAWRRLDAETALRAWGRENNVPVVVLRVAAIYGPGKLPRARLEKGLPVLREAESGFTNRIHADDLASICLAAMQHGRADEIYNVSDGSPGTMTDYFNQVADHLGLPRPAQISLAEAETQVSAGMLGYLKESRRIDNTKMVRELKVVLRYPSLQSGLNPK